MWFSTNLLKTNHLKYFDSESDTQSLRKVTYLCHIIQVATQLLNYEINVPLGRCGKACDLNGYLPSAQ